VDRGPSTGCGGRRTGAVGIAFRLERSDVVNGGQSETLEHARLLGVELIQNREDAHLDGRVDRFSRQDANHAFERDVRSSGAISTRMGTEEAYAATGGIPADRRVRGL